MSTKTDEFEQRLVKFCFNESKQLSLTKEQVADSLTKVGDILKKSSGI